MHLTSGLKDAIQYLNNNRSWPRKHYSYVKFDIYINILLISYLIMYMIKYGYIVIEDLI